AAAAAYREILHQIVHRENGRTGRAVHVATPRAVTTRSAKCHADRCSGSPISRSRGWSSAQTSWASGHRGWNAQPPGGNNIEGGAAALGVSRAARALSAGNEDRSPRVYGWRGRANTSSTSPISAV